MNKITVNGKTITVADGSIAIINGRIYVNGKLQQDDGPVQGDVTITVQGTVTSVSVDNGSVTLNGGVQGPIRAGGDVYVGGNSTHQIAQVAAGGDVKAGTIHGSIIAGGDVQHGK